MGYAYLHGLSFVLKGFLMNDHPSGGAFGFLRRNHSFQGLKLNISTRCTKITQPC